MSTRSLHEALFIENSTIMLDHVNEVWKELLTCVLCESPLRITTDNALRFFATEHIECPKCHAEQQFPLFWIMSHFVSGEPKQDEKTSA
jgi:hypothetical protein